MQAAKRRYFVFGILENSQLYLEYYTNEEAVYKLTPLKVIPLQTCKHVACSLPIGKYTHILTIVLEGRVLNLVADDRYVGNVYLGYNLLEIMDLIVLFISKKKNGNDVYLTLHFSQAQNYNLRNFWGQFMDKTMTKLTSNYTSITVDE